DSSRIRPHSGPTTTGSPRAPCARGDPVPCARPRLLPGGPGGLVDPVSLHGLGGPIVGLSRGLGGLVLVALTAVLRFLDEARRQLEGTVVLIDRGRDGLLEQDRREPALDDERIL